MQADGKFKIEIKSMSPIFSDCGKTVVYLGSMFRMNGLDATVWEKDHSGWQQISRV